MKRLDAFDILLTDWMLGFSILLLIAIKFAPGIVGQQTTLRPLVMPAALKFQQNGESVTASAVTWKEYCPIDYEALENHTCPKCHTTYPAVLVGSSLQPALVGPGFQLLLYVLLILFVVKYLHERSVLRFHLYEDDRFIPLQRKMHNIELRSLHERSNGWSLHILTFVSRILFLGFFYLFVINLYIQNGGVLKGLGESFYGALLIFGYIVPDVCLFISTRGQVYQSIKQKLERYFYRFLIGVVLFLGAFLILGHSAHTDPLIGLYIFVGLAVILALTALILVLIRFDQCSIEVTAFKWLLLDVFNLVAIAAFAIAPREWHVDTTWIACTVLVINLSDWLFSMWFYFGTDKFTIQGRQKRAAA